MEKKQYTYEGPVLIFGQLTANHWVASTCATTPEKARSNLSYQFKKEMGRLANCPVTLPGKLKEVE